MNDQQKDTRALHSGKHHILAVWKTLSEKLSWKPKLRTFTSQIFPLYFLHLFQLEKFGIEEKQKEEDR